MSRESTVDVKIRWAQEGPGAPVRSAAGSPEQPICRQCAEVTHGAPAGAPVGRLVSASTAPTRSFFIRGKEETVDLRWRALVGALSHGAEAKDSTRALVAQRSRG